MLYRPPKSGWTSEGLRPGASGHWATGENKGETHKSHDKPHLPHIVSIHVEHDLSFFNLVVSIWHAARGLLAQDSCDCVNLSRDGVKFSVLAVSPVTTN